MKIIFDKDLKDNKYSIEVKTEFTDQEQSLATKFGEPMVNFGGSIPGSPSYDLEDKYRLMKSGLPYTLSMDGNGDAQAKAKMNNWQAEISSRLLSAINVLRASVDDFSGEVIDTV